MSVGLRFWTAHLHADAEPVLIPEAFSWGALILGPLWLLAHRAWIPALLALATMIAIAALAPTPFELLLAAALSLLLGLSGQDLRRWSLERRGYHLGHVVAARTEAEAMGRLIGHRPRLADQFAARELRA